MSVGGTFAMGESRHPEWELMYRKGLTVGRIAELCGAPRETVGRHLRVQRTRFPEMQAEHEASRPAAKPASIRPSWQASVRALSVIWQEEGRYPTSSDPDPRKRRLGYWLAVQRRASRDGTLSRAKLDALEALPGWLTDQRKELDRRRWRERLVELQVFRTEHGRWPRFRNAKSEAERVLGVWLHGQRQKAFRNALTGRELRALGGAAPGWNTWQRQKPDLHVGQQFYN